MVEGSIIAFCPWWKSTLYIYMYIRVHKEEGISRYEHRCFFAREENNFGNEHPPERSKISFFKWPINIICKMLRAFLVVRPLKKITFFAASLSLSGAWYYSRTEHFTYYVYWTLKETYFTPFWGIIFFPGEKTSVLVTWDTFFFMNPDIHIYI